MIKTFSDIENVLNKIGSDSPNNLINSGIRNLRNLHIKRLEGDVNVSFNKPIPRNYGDNEQYKKDVEQYKKDVEQYRNDLKFIHRAVAKYSGKNEIDESDYENFFRTQKLKDYVVKKEKPKKEETKKPEPKKKFKEEKDEEKIAKPKERNFNKFDTSKMTNPNEKKYFEHLEEYTKSWFGGGGPSGYDASSDEWKIFLTLKEKMADWDSNIAAELLYIMRYAARQGYYGYSTDELKFVIGSGRDYRDIVYSRYKSSGVGTETEKFIKHIIRKTVTDERTGTTVRDEKTGEIKKVNQRARTNLKGVQKLKYSPFHEKGIKR